MTQKLSDLDLAIDVVAKRLTHVEDDQIFAAKIVAALPEQATSLRWLLTSWAPRLAVIAMAAATSVLLVNRAPQVTEPSLLPATPALLMSALPSAAEPLALGNLGTQPLEPLERLEPLEPTADHEFSLPSLDVASLPSLSMPEVASIELAPLAIADLPLTGEFPDGMKE